MEEILIHHQRICTVVVAGRRVPCGSRIAHTHFDTAEDLCIEHTADGLHFGEASFQLFFDSTATDKHAFGATDIDIAPFDFIVACELRGHECGDKDDKRQRNSHTHHLNEGVEFVLLKEIKKGFHIIFVFCLLVTGCISDSIAF